MVVNLDEKKRVSEVVLIDDIKSWNNGDLISIAAGTGSGKSYFIKNQLYPIAKVEDKKILYLVNRIRLKEQFEKEIKRDGKSDVIDIRTYQSIQSHVLYGNEQYFKMEYKYIVSDEFHYFFADATFNDTTDLSMNIILDAQDRIRIFMSATGDFALDYFEEYKKLNIKKYELDHDYNHIEKLFFYKDDEVVKKFLVGLNEDEKVLYFCHSAKKAYQLSNEFINSLFICSNYNSNYKKYLDKEKIEAMLTNERYNEQMLFTTQTLDNGINLIDENIKYIIIDVNDFDVMIQCLGRKRIINKNDKITVLIKTLNGKSLNGRISRLKKKIEAADFLLNEENSLKTFLRKYPRQYVGNMIYDISDKDDKDKSSKKVNEIMYHKCDHDIKLLNDLMQIEDGYMKFVSNNLFQRIEYEILEDYYDKIVLSDYLNSLVGKKLFNENQKKFKEFIDKNLISTPKKNHGSIGEITINSFFKENNHEYIIQSRKENIRNENRNKRYWLISKT